MPENLLYSTFDASILPSLPSSRVPGAWLYDLPQRLGRRGGPGHVWRGHGEVHFGQLLGAMGLHPGYHWHPGRTHPLLPGLCAGQPAERLPAGGA